MNVRTVLFLCTGNYYRSRFAEELFNHLAAQRSLRWRADSRGLAVGRTESVNVGPISSFTLEALQKRAIVVPQPIRYPRLATVEDFASADLIIALKEAEHRALVQQHFPGWEDRITYWHVHDLNQALPQVALAEIQTLVRELVERL